MSDLSGRTTIVVGASRGLGHGIATAFAAAATRVVAVSRTAAEFAGSAGTIQPEVADAADATAAASLLDRYEPEIVILVAGASPHLLPLQEQTWETFSVNWETDVRITFHWLREILVKPLRPGSRVVVISSGAARAWASPSPRSCPGSRLRPASASRRCRRTRPAPVSPSRTTSSRWVRWSPRSSPAPPCSNWSSQTPPTSPPPTS